MDAMLTAWVQLGYRREPQVETPGSFSLRGGILDVFSAQHRPALPRRTLGRRNRHHPPL